MTRKKVVNGLHYAKDKDGNILEMTAIEALINDEWRKQTLGEMLKAVIEKQQKEGRDSEEWGMLES